MTEPEPTEFEKAAAQHADASLLTEFREFLWHNKKWWLTPIILMLLVLGVIVILGSTAAAPFIYTLF